MTLSTPPTKPRALAHNATFALVSPASTPREELVERGTMVLRSFGYRARLFPHALDRGPLYYAGTAAQRAEDLHAAFADPTIGAILCTRGGWGSAELLPLLDAGLIRANPKPFLGYSDQTSLHLWLRTQANLVTFHAPMLAADFAKLNGVDLVSWRTIFEGQSTSTLGADSGLRTLRPGTATGELHGGCLSIYAESLGTPWSAQPRHGILFLEDIGHKPYQWDRQLLHLRHAGLLEHVTGIVFGDMAQCVAPEEANSLEASLLHALADFAGPIAIGLRSGHVARENITLPLGIQARLELTDSRAQLHLLEPAVL